MTERERVSGALKGSRCVPAVGLALCLLASACGGGGGGGGGGSSPPTSTTRITGSVYAGPVEGASVVAKDGAGRTVAGPVTTAAGGSYALDVPTPALAGELTFEASGGTFADEATGVATAGGRLSALAPAGSLGAGATVHLTPASTLLEDLVTRHGRTRTQAGTDLGAVFGFVPDHRVQPANASTGTLPSRLAGLRAAAFSQLTRDLGLGAGAQFALLAALAEDLADGVLDGIDGTTTVTVGGAPLPEDVQNRFAQALTGFLGCAYDHTGLNAGQIGFPPFAKVALTPTYRVEYVPVDPGAALGETPFRLRITDRATGGAVAGLGVALAPEMHMASSQNHGTPVGEVADNADGTYDGTVYYSMAGGAPYGYWSLTVGVDAGGGAARATFYPAVGSPSYAILSGQGDLDEGGARRAYYLFDAGLVEENPALGTYGFSLFVAAREDLWSFPPLTVGAVLHDETGTAWTVSSVGVEVSLDGIDWISAVPSTRGRWSVSGLTGIDPNSDQLTFYVRLAVNGEVKTTDGQPLAGDGANGFAELASGGASCCY